MIRQPIKDYCKNPFYMESSNLLDVFQNSYRQVFGSDLDIRQMKTATVFPEVISSGQQCLLCWDIQYWDFFDRFAVELACLIEDNSYQDVFLSQVCALYYDYLVLKLIHIPELAYCLQVNRKRLFDIQNQTERRMSLNTYNRYVEGDYEGIRIQAKQLTFNHELFHIFYKHNQREKLKDNERLSKLAGIYLDSGLEDNIKGADFAEVLRNGFDALLKADAEKMLEEACCDYRALIETLALYRKIDPQKEIYFIYQVHEAFRINQTLLSYFSNILSCWTILYKNYLVANSYDDLLQQCQPMLAKAAQMAVIRNTIIPDFLETLSIGKYHITLPQSILDNDIVKGSIHEASNRMVDMNFMFYAIEESLRLFNQPDYNPFELKNIILENAGYL